MVDNIELIKPLLNFEDKNDFYYLQILQRKKENPELGANSRVIKNYYINSINDLENKYTEIKKLCDFFNARASIRLNKRNYEKVAFKTMINISNNMINKDYYNIKNSYDRAIGQNSNDKNKKWIIDIDNDEVSPLMLSYINYNCEPISKSLEESKIYIIIKSKNGFHIITKPFNLKDFRKKYSNIDIHKDNPTNLYIP